MLNLGTINTVALIANAAPVHHLPPAPPPQLDLLTVSGFLVSLLTLLVWMHLGQSKACTLTFAACLLALAAYGFLQGAWPLGIVASIWSAATVRRWRQWDDIIIAAEATPRRRLAFSEERWAGESRMRRMFELN